LGGGKAMVGWVTMRIETTIGSDYSVNGGSLEKNYTQGGSLEKEDPFYLKVEMTREQLPRLGGVHAKGA